MNEKEIYKIICPPKTKDPMQVGSLSVEDINLLYKQAPRNIKKDLYKQFGEGSGIYAGRNMFCSRNQHRD